MCDTSVVLKNSSAMSKLIFAKNSDRSPNEPNIIVNTAAKDYFAEGETVDLTYISIPQVKHTHAVLMVKPVWTFGCEMGINEHGALPSVTRQSLQKALTAKHHL